MEAEGEPPNEPQRLGEPLRSSTWRLSSPLGERDGLRRAAGAVEQRGMARVRGEPTARVWRGPPETLKTRMASGFQELRD